MKRNSAKILAFTAAFAAACGGQLEARERPGHDGAPVLATLSASEAGEGTAQLKAGDLAAARVSFESTLSQDPDRVGALHDLAVSYYLDGRFDAARALFEEVVNRGAPRDQQAALVNLGELYALDGYLDAARAYFESARDIDAAAPAPHYALALLADLRGDGAGALALVRDAMRLDDGGAARSGFAFVYPEERLHLEALVAEASGDRAAAAEKWQALAASQLASLRAAARRRAE